MAKKQSQGKSQRSGNRNTVSRRGTTSGTAGRGSGGGRGSTRTAGGRTRTGGGGTTGAAGGTRSRGGSKTTRKTTNRATTGGRTASSGSQTAGRRPTGASGNRGERSSSAGTRNQGAARQERRTNRGASTSSERSRTRNQQGQTRVGRMDENRNEGSSRTSQEIGDQENLNEEDLYQRTTDYKQDVRRNEDVFAQTVQKSNLWLKQVMAEIGTDDKHRAYTALKSVLQTLRDRLTVEEATDLAAQMPALIRGIFFEGWKPVDKPVKYSREEFTDRIREQFRNLSGINHGEIIRGVFRVLQENIPEGEINHIIGTMPEEFAEFWMQDELVR